MPKFFCDFIHLSDGGRGVPGIPRVLAYRIGNPLYLLAIRNSRFLINAPMWGVHFLKANVKFFKTKLVYRLFRVQHFGKLDKLVDQAFGIKPGEFHNRRINTQNFGLYKIQVNSINIAAKSRV